MDESRLHKTKIHIRGHKYKIDYDQLLGEGGLGGQVFVCKRTPVEESIEYAMKKVFIAHLNDLEKEKAVREAELHYELSGDKHILTCYGHKDSSKGKKPSGFLYIALEKGEMTLQTWLKNEISKCKKTKFYLRKAKSDNDFKITLVKIILGISEGVQRIHNHQIAHRDLSLENIFVNHNEKGELEVKIGDFGISARVELDKATETRPIGQKLYLSPEAHDALTAQVKDDPLDLFADFEDDDEEEVKDMNALPTIKMAYLKQGDIWTLAIIANVLFTLRCPFNKVSDILAVFHRPVKLPKIKDKNIRRLLEKMLDKDPKKRPCIEVIIQRLKWILQMLKPKEEEEEGKKAFSLSNLDDAEEETKEDEGPKKAQTMQDLGKAEEKKVEEDHEFQIPDLGDQNFNKNEVTLWEAFQVFSNCGECYTVEQLSENLVEQKLSQKEAFTAVNVRLFGYEGPQKDITHVLLRLLTETRICALCIMMPKNLARVYGKIINKIIKNQVCLKILKIYFGGVQDDQLNLCNKLIFNDIPQDTLDKIEVLTFYYRDSSLDDEGFLHLTNFTEQCKYVKKLFLKTDETECTEEHIQELQDVIERWTELKNQNAKQIDQIKSKMKKMNTSENAEEFEKLQDDLKIRRGQFGLWKLEFNHDPFDNTEFLCEALDSLGLTARSKSTRWTTYEK